MEGDAPSWILVDHLFSPSKDQLVLQVDIQHSNWINVTVEKREKEDNVPAWKTLLFHFFEGKASASADDANRTIDSVLESCRRRYGQGSPLFGNSLRLKDVSGQPQVVEAMDPSLESILRTADHLFGGEVSLPPLISRTDLQSAVIENGSFMPQTKPVWYKGEMYVAKGPASAERAYEDLSEVSNLLALPTHHPNIIPAPIALITLSRDDRRICGFLFPLYKNGNVDLYARRKRSHDQFFDRTLLKWCKQLVSAVKSLIDADTFHGDIKPDNVLISDSEDLVLIDLARSFTTMAIASPEVKQSEFQLEIKPARGFVSSMTNICSRLPHRTCPSTIGLANPRDREIGSVFDR